MKKKFIFAFSTVVLVLQVCGPALHALDVEISLISRYIWRGFDLLPQNKPVLQPSLTIDFAESGFSLNLWSSFGLAERRVYRELDEIDLTLHYERKISEKLYLGIGFTHYGYYFARSFSLRNNTTQELYLTLGLRALALAPEISLFYDFNLGDGFYGQIEFAETVFLRESLSLEAGARLGYNGGQYGISPGFSDLTFFTALAFRGKVMTLTPFINLTWIFNHEINTDKVEVHGGLTLSF